MKFFAQNCRRLEGFNFFETILKILHDRTGPESWFISEKNIKAPV